MHDIYIHFLPHLFHRQARQSFAHGAAPAAGRDNATTLVRLSGSLLIEKWKKKIGKKVKSKNGIHRHRRVINFVDGLRFIRWVLESNA